MKESTSFLNVSHIRCAILKTFARLWSTDTNWSNMCTGRRQMILWRLNLVLENWFPVRLFSRKKMWKFLQKILTWLKTLYMIAREQKHWEYGLKFLMLLLSITILALICQYFWKLKKFCEWRTNWFSLDIHLKYSNTSRSYLTTETPVTKFVSYNSLFDYHCYSIHRCFDQKCIYGHIVLRNKLLFNNFASLLTNA